MVGAENSALCRDNIFYYILSPLKITKKEKGRQE